MSNQTRRNDKEYYNYLVHTVQTKGEIFVGDPDSYGQSLPPGADGDIIVYDSAQFTGVKTSTFNAAVPDPFIVPGDVCIPGELQVDSIVEKTLDNGVDIENIIHMENDGGDAILKVGEVSGAGPTLNSNLHVQCNRDAVLFIESDADGLTPTDSVFITSTRKANAEYVNLSLDTTSNFSIQTAGVTAKPDILFDVGGTYVNPGPGVNPSPAGFTRAMTIDGTTADVTIPNGDLSVTGGDVIISGQINTGPGLTDVFAMNQNVRSTDSVVFNTVNTGQGANELYIMDQNVRSTDAVSFASINTGFGANELYPMNQAVRTSDDVTFSNLIADGPASKFGDSTTAQDCLLIIQSKQDALLYIESDTDNVTESDNPSIIMTQDGNAVGLRIGTESAGSHGYIETISSGGTNDLVIRVGGVYADPGIGVPPIPDNDSSPPILAATFKASTQTLELAQGLELPTIGGTPSTLNFYESFLWATDFSGPYASPVAGSIQFVRIGEFVQATVTSTILATAVAGASISTDIIPTRFNPTNGVNEMVTVRDNGSDTSGLVRHSAGRFIFELWTGTSFSGAGSTGLPVSGVSFSYAI